METYSQNESLNEVISYNNKKFIVVKRDKSIHILTEVEMQKLSKEFILSVNQYSPERYTDTLNEISQL